jgi:pimeloyl-ACP methyl ester carboxylesterase
MEELVSVNDVDLFVDQRGDGEPLVLLHGMIGCHADWKLVFDLDALAERHRVLSVDLRGHGQSTNPSGVFSHRQCARDLIALLDALGIESYSGIGLSLGANTLLHAAIAQPERARSLVLVAATTHFPEQARAIMRSVDPDTQPESEWAIQRQRHPRGDDQIRALWQHARDFADSHDDMNLVAADLAKVRARTLIVNGDRDPLYPVEISLALYRGIPNASLFVIPGGGHGPIFADFRDAFAHAALAFVRA